MGPRNIFVSLFEHGPESVGTAVVRGHRGRPGRSPPPTSAPTACNAPCPARPAAQWFFSTQGRAFCLYAVLGQLHAASACSPATSTTRCPPSASARPEPGHPEPGRAHERPALSDRPSRHTTKGPIAMNDQLAGLGAVIAIAAAARSTWSPCGLSMLSTITPLAERSRGHRFGVTASWFIARRDPRRRHARPGRRRPGRRACGPPASAPARRRRVAAVLALVCGASDVRAVRAAPALPRTPGQRAVAGPVPTLGLRQRVRLADRHRPRHLHPDRGRVPAGRAGRAHRQPGRGHRRCARCSVWSAAWPCCCRSGITTPARLARLPPPLRPARARRCARW